MDPRAGADPAILLFALRACLGASVVPPDELVHVERDPDGGDEREGDQRGYRQGDREQRHASCRGDDAAAAEAPRDT